MKTKADIAYEKLKNILISMDLPPGHRLTETAWSNELGVNRDAIRRALLRLEGEGLLCRGEKCGFFVREYDFREILEIFESRRIIELGSIDIIVARAESEDIAELESICDQMAMLETNGYVDGIGEAERKFHSALIKAAHNEKLLQIYIGANMPIAFSVRHSPKLDPTAKESEKHRAIVKAISRKDAKAARDLLGEGFDLAVSTWKKRLKYGELEK